MFEYNSSGPRRSREPVCASKPGTPLKPQAQTTLELLRFGTPAHPSHQHCVGAQERSRTGRRLPREVVSHQHTVLDPFASVAEARQRHDDDDARQRARSVSPIRFCWCCRTTSARRNPVGFVDVDRRLRQRPHREEGEGRHRDLEPPKGEPVRPKPAQPPAFTLSSSLNLDSLD